MSSNYLNSPFKIDNTLYAVFNINCNIFVIVSYSMLGGELFAKISERTTPFTEQGK